MSAPRRCFTLCSPRTQAIASATLLLPQPFGPTTAVMPSPVKMRSVWSAKDLKPVISRRLSLNIDVRHLMRGVAGIKGDDSRRQYKGTPPTCQPKLQLRNFNCRTKLCLAVGWARPFASPTRSAAYSPAEDLCRDGGLRRWSPHSAADGYQGRPSECRSLPEKRRVER